jgi:Fic family protein
MPSDYQERMAKELAAIEEIVKKYPAGITIEEIRKDLGFPIELRTLQRRLSALAGTGVLKLSGIKRSTKYHPVKDRTNASYYLVNDDKNASIVQENENIEKAFPIPLSRESKEILSLLATPWGQRRPVGYKRKFVDSYRPNIDFYLDKKEREQLARLGAAHGNLDQPAGTYAKQILQRLLIDLSWNSSRLEGNTYSLLDTERLLSGGEPAPDKSAAEAQMILNHKDAIEFMVRGAGEIGFNRYTLLNLHALLSNNLLPDPAAPGRLRTHAVGIQKSAYTPTGIPQLIEEMFDDILSKAAAIHDPHEQALFAMVQLPYLQPFEDVNKRLSRLAANISLNKNNLVPISFIGVPENLYIQGLLVVYELNKTALLKDIFLWACARSADRYAQVRQTIGEPDPFRIKYRQALQSAITEIISRSMSSSEASLAIKNYALQIPEADREQFIELAETELLSLHEGNFARYHVSPQEFQQWKNGWKN